MSFSSQLKTELCSLRVSDCCRKAFCYGFMLFGQSFSRDKISLLTENEEVAKTYATLIRQNFDVICKTAVSTGKRPMQKVWVNGEADRLRIFNMLKLKYDEHSTIDHSLMPKSCCRDSFIRGVFLACGQAANPTQEYRVEMRIKKPELAYSLFDLLYKRNLEPKITLKSLSNVIYIKKSERVEDFFTVIGATPAALEMMDIKIMKEVRTKINRRNNYDLANTTRAVEASITQRAAINYLIESGKFSALPEQLQEIALLRCANPEASLGELCRLCSTSISRSGMNHRIQRILDIAKEFENKE